MNIDLTDFWIDRPYISNTNNFSILSDKYCNLQNCYLGNSKAYYYSGLVEKYQLKCVVIDDTFYLDFSANQITDQIKQQMWILKHTKGIEYKLEFVCLWEMFKLPTAEQLNEFARVKQEVAAPIFSEELYNQAIEEMRLSTELGESSLLLNIHYSLSEYVELMLQMSHSRLNAASVRHYATIIHNYHHPVVEEVAEVSSNITTNQEEYEEVLNELLENLDIDPSDILPLSTSTLEEYLEYLSDNVLVDGTGETFINIDTIDRYGTIVYNYHNGTQE